MFDKFEVNARFRRQAISAIFSGLLFLAIRIKAKRAQLIHPTLLMGFIHPTKTHAVVGEGKLRSLNHPSFVLTLGLLVLNDFYLKYEYHNWITGKLSDVAGLFVFTWFWSSVLPKQHRAVHLFTGIAFTFWKSCYAQPFIDFFSENFYCINRTIDPTDLLALAVLPLSYFFKQKVWNPKGWIQNKVVPIPLTLLTIFSFCATSVPKPSQYFEEPEYVLFRNDGLQQIDRHVNDLFIFDLDSISVVLVKSIEIEQVPARDDDYQKNQVLGNLDLRVLCTLKSNQKLGDLSSCRALRDSLTISGNTSLTLDLDSVSDELNFRNTRLHGSYKRYAPDKQLLIDGLYKNGIRDSIWTVYGRDKRNITRRHFQAGELTKIEHIHDGKTSTENIYTRRGAVIRQYVILTSVAVLVAAALVGLIRNFLSITRESAVRIPTMASLCYIVFLPMIITHVVSIFTPDVHSDFLSPLTQFTRLNLILIPLLAIIRYGLRLRSRYDLLLYPLLFVLIIIWIEQYQHLIQIAI
jgi:hypothetical protein